MEYLRKAGKCLTDNHGLCNIGQWHSHHKIQLFGPSVGDENTVWNNMPNLGLDRYIVFIANITHKVTINCFLFQVKNGRKLPVMAGKFVLLKGNSPFRLDENLLQNTHIGSESLNDIAVFEEEMKHLRDMPENHNLETYNKNETGNDIGNRKTKVNLSANQENNEKSYNPHIITHFTQPNKHTVSIYHVPEAERLKALAEPKRNSHISDTHPDTFRKPHYSKSLHKTSEENLKSYHLPKGNTKKKNEQEAGKFTYAERPEYYSSTSFENYDQKQTKHFSAAPVAPRQVFQKQQVHTEITQPAFEQQGRRDYNLAQTMQRQNEYKVTVTGSNRTQQYHNTDEQQENRDTNFRVNDQSSSSCTSRQDFETRKQSKHKPSGNYNSPCGNDEQDKQRIEAKTPKNSESCIHPSGKLQDHMNTFRNEGRHTTKNLSTEDTQEKTFPTVTYKGTENRKLNVIVNQPQTLDHRDKFNLKRKSGEYDNVRSDYEPPQCKTSKLNNDDNESSDHGNLEKIQENPGRVSSETALPQEHHEDQQIRHKRDNENTRKNWLFDMCCMMGRLTIHDETESQQHSNV